MEKIAIEKGPIRPPSEAYSLLIRATRNCPWNRCAFCHTYQGNRFKLRTVDEIRDDIRKAKRVVDRIRDLSRVNEKDPDSGKYVVKRVFDEGEFAEDCILSIASWLYSGGDSVFIQDADSLIMKTDDLVNVLRCIREAFPDVRQITSYCRTKTAVRKSRADLLRLREEGLTRVHVGIESGYDPLLRFIDKGVTAAEQVEGAMKLKEAGLILCTYVMPGLGGKRWSREHAVESAGVINLIDPDFVRLRTLHLVKGSRLHTMMENGEFEPLAEEDIVRELRIFIEHLHGIETTIASDHVLNLLEEITGKLPEEKTKLLETIDRFFSLTPEERLVFRVGRRRGIYHRLNDLADMNTFLWLKAVVDQYMGSDPGQLEAELEALMHSFI